MNKKFTPGETYLILDTILEYAGTVYNMQKALDCNDWNTAKTYEKIKNDHWNNIKKYLDGNFEN